MRLKSTPYDELTERIATARAEMLEYRRSGDTLLEGCAEERMNKWLEDLTKLTAA